MKMYLAIILSCLAVSVIADAPPATNLPAPSCAGAISGRKLDLKCTACKLVIGAVKSLVGSDMTTDKIEAALNKVCSTIPSGMKSQCETLVSMFASTIIPMLIDAVPAKKICQKIKMCKKGIFGFSTVRTEDSAVSSGCAICKLVKLVINEEQSKGKSGDDVSDAVERACLGFPYSTRQECASMAAIVQSAPLSSPFVDPCDAICYSPPQAPVAYASPTTCPQKEEGFAVTCEKCTPVMDFIRKRSQNLPSNEVVENFDVACYEMDEALTPTCVTYLTAFEPIIADQIIAGASSKATCQAISMC